jgi:hypothetical protein
MPKSAYNIVEKPKKNSDDAATGVLHQSDMPGRAYCSLQVRKLNMNRQLRLIDAIDSYEHRFFSVLVRR